MKSASKSPIEYIETVVIGASQAGLSTSYYLTQNKLEHVVIEKETIGVKWMSERWDSFCLVTPNWMNNLPGYPYNGNNSDGFLARADIVNYLESYAESFGAPIRTGVSARKLKRNFDGTGYRLETNKGTIKTKNIVVCTGYFHKPNFPEFSKYISPSIEQISSSQYRNPNSLSPGGVVVVGSGQSGCQIAEELKDAGRDVYLCVSSAPREPRKYRGKDINYWFNLMGTFDKSFNIPLDPKERRDANPHCSGKNGGHALNLMDFQASGITLLGRVKSAELGSIKLESNVNQDVGRADSASKKYMKTIDQFILGNNINAPQPDQYNTDDGNNKTCSVVNETAELNLIEKNIKSIVWATGFSCDYSWVNFDVLDKSGYPKQLNGVTPHSGLYFCGLHWMQSLKSGLLFGVGDGAKHITTHIRDRLLGNVQQETRARSSLALKVSSSAHG
jgi:putative flavoprotein involved in K+ transport